MGLLRFRFAPDDLATRLPGLRRAYLTGLDRTPGRTVTEVRPGALTCRRDDPESGRLHVPWPVAGFGIPIVSTATLAERPEPHDLAVELARGRLNDVRNQAADWQMQGLETSAELDQRLLEASRAFAHAAVSRDDPAAAAESARRSLAASFRAAELLMASYTEQVLRRRRDYSKRLSTLLSCGLEGDPKKKAGYANLLPALNAARINCTWARLAPTEGRLRWDEPDSQLAWCRSQKLTASAGPLVELRPGRLPDWLWLWQGDYEQIAGMAEDLTRQAVARYRGKVATWHLVHRAGTGEVLGLGEEDQVRLMALVLRTARRADPDAQLVIDFERPWAGWLAAGTFQLGPLHTADSLARADLGLGGIGLEIAPGFGPPGSHFRDLLDLSRLLDLFALVGLPLHVSVALPSSAQPDPKADPGVVVEADTLPRPPDEAFQRVMAAQWIALAVAKPYVRSVHWLQPEDAAPHIFPHAGLLRPDGTPKPLVEWLTAFRAEYLE
jgi:hypothetical protein